LKWIKQHIPAFTFATKKMKNVLAIYLYQNYRTVGLNKAENIVILMIMTNQGINKNTLTEYRRIEAINR